VKDTKIEWCDDTSNFVTGCIHGCDYCYARRMATRFAGKEGTVYHRLRRSGFNPFTPAFHWDVLEKLEDRLLNVKCSRRVFIASMGDVCCDTTFCVTSTKWPPSFSMSTTDVLMQIYELCCKHPRHTFLLLSKNPQLFNLIYWPKNVHVGTSIDRTDDVTISRIRDLSRVTASVRWLSVEPILDPAFMVNDMCVDGFKPDWIVVGGLSGRKPLPRGCVRVVERIVIWGQHHHIPVFLKDNLPRINGDRPQEYPV